MKGITRDLKIISITKEALLSLQVPEIALYSADASSAAALENICINGLMGVLLDMGLAEKMGGVHTGELYKQLGIVEKYERLFRVMLSSLEAAGYLTGTGDRATVADFVKETMDGFKLEDALSGLVENNPEYIDHARLLKSCLTSLGAILRGEKQATEIIFPSGSLDYVSGIYKGNSQSDYFNGLLSDMVAGSVHAAAALLKEGEKIRILEVGAGTGGSSEMIFEKLYTQKANIEYCYTDVSRGFLLYAEEKYRSVAPYLITGLLDIEKSFEEQGYQSGSFDLVIGANVIHATRDIARTLNNLKGLLKKEGLLLLNELARTELYSTLTFGLLDGWWLYEDAELRLEGSPGLPEQNWMTVLGETGFNDPEAYPKNANLSQQIITAKSDGIVKIKQGRSELPVSSAKLNVKKGTAKKGEKFNEDWLTQKLITIVADTIKLPEEEFDVDEQFLDFGFDSILGNNLMKNINERLNVSLKPTDIFSYPNIGQLSKYIRENFSNDAVADIYRSEENDPGETVTNATEYTSRRQIKANPLNEVNVEIRADFFSTEEVAIIGVSGQFGYANNMEEFWGALKVGKSLIREIPADRWDISEYYSTDRDEPNKTYSKWGAFIRDIYQFDPLFFRISGNEAELMDPQQRLFIEHCWAAIEDAGINPQTLNSTKCGVYVGAGASDYLDTIENKAASAFWGNSSSVLASRISYFLDLKGPAISIDTACSSSMVAMDLACSSLQKGDTDIVIAGGVTVINSVDFYQLASRAGMLSPDGQCYAFDERANGFVPGEGVGVLLMKRLKDAQRDGDHIYGVIKGILTNQDGTTSGITAPSALSQKELEKEVYDKFKIDPSTISYVEAHGTGTKLGDPIEFQGLCSSFELFTNRKQFCGLGSVKSNIGHTLMAAGVAGVLKVLLSLKYQQLPPTINYQKCNPLINLADSPFRIQDKLEAWERISGMPLRAAVSSFGFSGTNAHLVIEEYTGVREQYRGPAPYLLVLSARNGDRLKDQVMNLYDYVVLHDELDLYDMCYTLQTGREAMEERLSLVFSNRQELLSELEHYREGRETKISTGNSRKTKRTALPVDITLEGLISSGDYRGLLSLWIAGYPVDWDLLYGDTKPRRVSLPTYPFARGRYWVEAAELHYGGDTKLHPLVHYNISNLQEQKYSSIFTGSEYFLSDHKIVGKKIMPGVAYLELALVAGELSMLKKLTQLINVSWERPFVVSGEINEAEISLHPSGDKVSYEVSTQQGAVIHCRGMLSTKVLHPVAGHDLQVLQERLSNRRSGEECYRLFRERGLVYGAGFRGITTLFYNHEEALSHISLPVQKGYTLPPGVLDSAFQTCLGLSFAAGEAGLPLPFSVSEVNIYHELPYSLWCYVRKSAGNKRRGSGKLYSYDIDLLNDQGEVLLCFKELISLPSDHGVLDSGDALASSSLSVGSDVHCYESCWQDKASSPLYQGEAEQLVLLAGGTVDMAEGLKQLLEVEVLVVEGTSAVSYFKTVLERVREKLNSKELFNITVLCSNSDYVDYGFVSGLLKTAARENSKFRGKVVAVDSLSVLDVRSVSAVLSSELQTQEWEVRYITGKREVRALEAITVPDRRDGSGMIKEGGVYLLTGGAGGLGLVLGEDLARTPGVKVILAGRGDISEDKISEMHTRIGRSEYLRCDVSNRESVQELISHILNKHGRLDGVIHCAGVLRDSLILNKTAEEIAAVLPAKIYGARNLDEATRELRLDFMVYFSSVAALTGNVGQSDYASANAYLDNYAMSRNAAVARGERYGPTLSINWSLWEQGRMKPDRESARYFESAWGIAAMPSLSGTGLFRALAGSAYQQIVAIYGKKEMIIKNIFESGVEHPPAVKTSSPLDKAGYDKLKSVSLNYLRRLLSVELKIAEEKIEADVSFGKYGIDSILINKLTNRLSEDFTNVPRTLFFEYQSLEELLEYFMEAHSGRLEELTGMHSRMTTVPSPAGSITLSATPADKKRFMSDTAVSSPVPVEDIAIIGLSGRYPGAVDVKSFWENLKAGKDCITEIPAERWDLSGFYDPEKGKPGMSYSKWGGFIDDVDKFDPLFFNISPREAELMDPQERLFLQTVWETIEDAGYSRLKLDTSCTARGSDLGGSVGVYVGVMYEEYPLFGIEERHKGNFVTPGGSPSSIANRVSYFFNFHGPSMAVDTMCSSSLTAIHLACESIRNGNCAMAIAGGVNVSVHPAKYLMLSQGRFVSSKGHCESFGEGADGYVPGEGVGSVLLKRLSAAQADGDQIYGVIKSSVINHGGKTNSYTVPNPRAQSILIETALRKAGVSGEDISYVEAHGTGTSLGDPIEMAGLMRAFQSSRKQYCRIGSVKSNIGHAESAAGISGITKVLLQLKHRQLVPSLHSSSLNPNIDFENSPFKVQQSLEDWASQEGRPLVAGISSFGAGGSNAHIIIAEYQPEDSGQQDEELPVIIVLSAKNEERLRIHVENFRNYLEASPEISLAEVAYTLQTGREAMEERLALIAGNLQELTDQLDNYLKGNLTGIHTGNTKKDKSDLLLSGEAGQLYIEKLTEVREFAPLAQLWVKGIVYDWNALYKKGTPKKISLPTYPFAKEKYWISNKRKQNGLKEKNKLHILLHNNESNFLEQKYTSIYTGKEPFLMDHKIGAEKLLPGVAYLELAREAGARSINQKITQLKDVSWLSPIFVNGTPKEIQIKLFKSGEDLAYEVYCEKNKTLIHNQGRLSTKITQNLPNYDIETIRERLKGYKEKIQLYEFFKQKGLAYGDSFQGIEKVYYNKNEALSVIKLPLQEEYVLTPGVLDSALQTCIALGFSVPSQELYLPFNVKEINIFQNLPETIWCYVREIGDSLKEGKIKKYDIDLLNATGEVLLNFKEFSVLPLNKNQKLEGSEISSPSIQKIPSLLYKPVWKRIKSGKCAFTTGKNILIVTGSAPVKFTSKLLDLLSETEADVKEVKELNEIPPDITDIFLLQGLSPEMGDISVADGFEQREVSLFSSIKILFESGFKTKKINLTAFTCNTQKVLLTDHVRDSGSGIVGFLGSLTKEQPLWNIRMLDLEDFENISIEKEILAFNTEDKSVIGCRRGNYYQRQLYQMELSSEKKSRFRNGGTYIILGGAGGIGRATSAYLIKKHNASVIWLGRRPLDEKIIQSQNELEALGSKPAYFQCDANKEQNMEDTFIEIKKTYKEIHGLFHFAIVLNDKMVSNMSKEDFMQSFNPKALTGNHFINCFKKETLDFICFYSSAQSQLTAPGQSNYAAGCTYLDSLALKTKEEHSIETCIINWGYWGEVGAVSSDYYKQRMEQVGLGSISITEGMEILEILLSNKIEQALAIKFI